MLYCTLGEHAKHYTSDTVIVDIDDHMYKIRKGGIKLALFGEEIKNTHSRPPTFRKSQVQLASAKNQTHKFSGHGHRLQRYVKIQQPIWWKNDGMHAS